LVLIVEDLDQCGGTGEGSDVMEKVDHFCCGSDCKFNVQVEKTLAAFIASRLLGPRNFMFTTLQHRYLSRLSGFWYIYACAPRQRISTNTLAQTLAHWQFRPGIWMIASIGPTPDKLRSSF
jgi:hypothetical protein